MKITRRQLRRLIKEEMSLMMMDPADHHDHHHGGGCGDERKTGKKCSSCAAKKPCPCGGDMSDIRGLDSEMPDDLYGMEDEGSAWASGDVVHEPMSGDEAFGAGFAMGQEERDAFSYTGDVSDLGEDEAIGIGYHAGLMGLDDSPHGHDMSVPHPQSYDAVMEFLRSNPELVEMAVEELMGMTGSTCQVSTRMAVADYLVESL